jgi:hypothetical protein
MKIRIHFLGNMARRAGGGRRTIDVPNPATLADAVQALTSDDAIAGELSRCTYSVGGVIVGASYQLLEGAELLVEPPQADTRSLP